MKSIPVAGQGGAAPAAADSIDFAGLILPLKESPEEWRSGRQEPKVAGELAELVGQPQYLDLACTIL